MAFHYGFFDSKSLDRTYTAENFTQYLSTMVCDGIQDNFGGKFAATAADGVSISLASGKAWLDGHYFLSDSPYVLDLSEYVDESLDRIVSLFIVCSVAESERMCWIETVAGTPGDATPPSFTPTTGQAFFRIYDIKLPAGTTQLSASDITDRRTAWCECILGKCGVTELRAEVATFNSTVEKIEADVAGIESGSLSEAVQEVQAKQITMQAQLDYVNNLANTNNNRLGDVEYNKIPSLQREIDALKEDASSIHDDISALQTTTTDMASTVSSVSGRMDYLQNTTVPSIQSSLLSLDSKMDTVEDDISTVKKQIETMVNSIIDLTNRVAALEG